MRATTNKFSPVKEEKHPMKHKLKKWITIFSALVFSASCSKAISDKAQTGEVKEAPAPSLEERRLSPAQKRVKEADSSNLALSFSEAIADTVEQVMPSVVMIETGATRIQRDWWGRKLYSGDVKVGQGSGVIISQDGFILTNNHVLQGADRATVILADGNRYNAKFVGNYAEADMAILKIKNDKGHKFKSIKRGDSDKLRVGEYVLAIGSPFGYQSTVTQGIVSQKGRRNEELPFVDFIQTSAAINPGNSGGPLVNIQGELVGINTFIVPAGPMAYGNVGLGFAVPSNQSLAVADSLINGNSLPKSWIGITMQELNPPVGVYVTTVHPDSPAEKAGVKVGDIVVEIANRRINYASQLRSMVKGTRPGEPLLTKIVRDERLIELSLSPAYMTQKQKDYR